jgi:chorismate lyase/3-hydroxybenzoate synthase
MSFASDFAPIFPAAAPVGEKDGFNLYRAGDLLLGHTASKGAGDLAAQAQQLYRRLFTVTEGWHLYRVWNQVPSINGVEAGGLENYRAFSAGRSQAFEERFGSGFHGQLPAASGVGTALPELTVAFAAGIKPARHFENPDQIPAYQYPVEHGPRAPSFARATFGQSEGRSVAFISGTAAIKGHRTIAPFTLPGQLACTLDNLGLIGTACGIGPELGAGGPWNRHFKVYYRAEEDRPAIVAALNRDLLIPGDDVHWRRADLCRADLLVEVEATLLAP